MRSGKKIHMQKETAKMLLIDTLTSSEDQDEESTADFENSDENDHELTSVEKIFNILIECCSKH